MEMEKETHETLATQAQENASASEITIRLDGCTGRAACNVWELGGVTVTAPCVLRRWGAFLLWVDLVYGCSMVIADWSLLFAMLCLLHEFVTWPSYPFVAAFCFDESVLSGVVTSCVCVCDCVVASQIPFVTKSH